MKRTLMILMAGFCVPLITDAATPDACSLLTAKDATALAGEVVSVVPSPRLRQASWKPHTAG